ncbi:major histocompatibility complex class I-related gene protein-like [Scleropages formosus]|uniref:major histocompatibility complex class I-related gene protein-like n=1 Tax=Scleropages formosus TaxID=113540 RepID=UPI000878200A|nr:major histocompatibility complex class I-related gene protein-like [Scleropages formosus]
MVNDIPVEYYDSNVTRIVSRRHWIVNESIEESHLKNFVVQKIYKSMKMQSHRLTQRFNHAGKTITLDNKVEIIKRSEKGVHVYQKFAACDLEGDSLTRFFLQDAYEGVETRNYDILTQAYSPLVPELIWTKVQMETKKLTYINVYQPLCLRTLRRYLQENKNILLRKVRPRVRVMRKANVASGKMNIVCLATGFYPRHIKMTLLRDERAVPDEELTAGEVFPNGDGTYQLRRSLALSEEEQRKKHVYTCTVTHLSLDNKLDVRWEPESASSPALYAGISLLIVLSVMGITGTLCWRRRTGCQHQCETAPAVKYSAAQGTEHSDTSSNS